MTGEWGGVVPMHEDRYDLLAEMIGAALLERRPWPVAIDATADDEQCALYVAVNASGYACYGGQTRPSSWATGAARRRIEHHLREESKAAEWMAYWVFPLRPDTVSWHIDELERAINARLGLPLDPGK